MTDRFYNLYENLKVKGSQNTKEKKVKGLILPHVKFYYKVLVIKTLPLVPGQTDCPMKQDRES